MNLKINGPVPEATEQGQEVDNYGADKCNTASRESKAGGEHPAIIFLRDFHGDAPWHLIAIKQPGNEVKACSFSGNNREARAVEWIERFNNSGYSIYFAINPLKCKGICKKAGKADVAAAHWLWSDIDPPKGATPAEIEAWRSKRVNDYTAGRPQGLPPPTFHIDSGRGFWRFWRLREPAEVDGKDGPKTALVESYGRGIEVAFTPEAADACRNIDRIARLPGTINHKTKKRAVVLEHRPERAYALTDFPQVLEEAPPTQGAALDGGPRAYAAFDVEALSERLRRTIREGAYDDFGGDRSRAVFYVTCELLRANISDDDIASVLLNHNFKISEHVYAQKHPRAYAHTQIKNALKRQPRGENAMSDYAMSDEGLFVRVPKRGMVRVCAPFEILGASRDPGGREWGKCLRWRDEDGRVHVKIISEAKLQGDAGPLCGELAAGGLKIDPDFQKALRRYLAKVPVEGRVTVATRTGWHDFNGRSIFVLPNETIGSSEGEHIILNPEVATAQYESQGTLADWRNSVGKAAKGQTLLTFACATALAGPLLFLTGQEGGGVHFCGNSAIGKTLLLQIIASFYGRGSEENGFILTWRATSNSLEGAAEQRCDTALVIDELGQVEAKEAGQAIYMLANGSGKGRATREGERRESKSWRVIIISSGEHTVETKLAEDDTRKVRAGQVVRVIDVQSERTHGVLDSVPDGYAKASKFVDATKRATRTHYGTAGPEFVRQLIARKVDGDIIRDRVNQFVESYAPNALPQVGRVALRLGLIAVAGELATEFGILPFDKGECEKGAAFVLLQWIEAHGGNQVSEEERRIIAQVRFFIEKHGRSRFQPKQKQNDILPIHNRAGWVDDSNPQRTRYLIPGETWKKEVCNGFDPVQAARVLAKHGFLERGTGDELARRERISELQKTVRVYVINESILEGYSEPPNARTLSAADNLRALAEADGDLPF